MANGIIIIDKPADWTSMDVCAKLRGILKTKKGGPRRDTGSHGHRRAAGVCGTGYPWRQLR